MQIPEQDREVLAADGQMIRTRRINRLLANKNSTHTANPGYNDGWGVVCYLLLRY